MHKKAHTIMHDDVMNINERSEEAMDLQSKQLRVILFIYAKHLFSKG